MQDITANLKQTASLDDGAFSCFYYTSALARLTILAILLKPAFAATAISEIMYSVALSCTVRVALLAQHCALVPGLLSAKDAPNTND